MTQKRIYKAGPKGRGAVSGSEKVLCGDGNTPTEQRRCNPGTIPGFVIGDCDKGTNASEPPSKK